MLALLLVLWALLEWSVRSFVTKLKIGHEVLTAASSFFKKFIANFIFFDLEFSVHSVDFMVN